MRHVKLIVCKDENSGELGFVPNIFKGWDSYRASYGRGLAHDLMEHSTKETGEAWQEFKALGAYLYVRDFGRNIDIWRGKPLLKKLQQVAEGIAFDAISIYNDLTEFGGDEAIPEITPRRFSKGKEELFRAIFNRFRDIAVNYWRGEHEVEEGDEDDTCPYADKLHLIEAWVREGYYLARERYKGEYVYDMFERMGKLLDYGFLSKHSLQEGDEVSLGYDIMTGELKVALRYDVVYG